MQLCVHDELHEEQNKLCARTSMTTVARRSSLPFQNSVDQNLDTLFSVPYIPYSPQPDPYYPLPTVHMGS